MAKPEADELELNDTIVAATEQARDAAIVEVRKYLPLGLEEQFLATADAAITTQIRADHEILGGLRTFPTLRDQRLQEALARFETEGAPTEDFRAGILFAVRLFADTDYEY